MLEWLFIQFLSFHLDTFDLVFCCKYFEDFDLTQKCAKTWRNGGKKEYDP